MSVGFIGELFIAIMEIIESESLSKWFVKNGYNKINMFHVEKSYNINS